MPDIGVPRNKLISHRLTHARKQRLFCATGAWQIHQHFNDERKMDPCQKASDGYQGLGHVTASYLPVMRNIKEHKFVKIDR